MKHVLFRKIFLSSLIIALILLISLEIYLSSVVKDTYLSNLKDSLMIQAKLMAEELPLTFTNNLDDFCKRYKEKTGARVTIIDSLGRVLGDSDEPSEKMENHANRPEIRDAEISDVGSSIRFSKTIQKNFFYLAIAVNQDSDKMFLRLSLPLHGLEKAMNKIRMRIVIASLSALFIAILIGIFQTRKITKSIEEITSFSQEVKTGDFKKRLFLKEKGELGDLGKNISDMAQELNNRLQQSEDEKRKMEAILRNMSDGLLLTDKKGRILLFNSSIKKIFDIETNIEGKTIMETFKRAELMEVIDKVVEGKKTISREITVTYPKELSLMTTATPFYSHASTEEMSGVVLMFHDITRLRQLEEVRKDFVANVSHEIKTPITAIKGFAETLLEGALDDRENAFKFLETIRNHSERLNSLVSDLLTLSQIELGDIKIEKTTVYLDDVVDTVFTMVKDRTQNKGLYLKKEIAPDVQEIKADRNRLIQILLNLVDNGIKFTEEGGVTVKVISEKLKVKSEGKNSELLTLNSQLRNFIKISVEDTGIGIPKKHIPRLGERFYRVDRARSRELGGTGLGLAIVKHLVKTHGWDMEIESTEGKGTKVSILCPLS
ncbi:MAG: cell wall metabolism sensor histidine kinase WalK [Nitrospira sp.]|nr:cell wall metabolism sensor histidine kinase WalK [Nitrospira sp.]